MSGYEYTERGYNADPMGGFQNNNYDSAGGSGGFMGGEEKSAGRGSDKKVCLWKSLTINITDFLPKWKQSRDRQSLIPLSVKQALSASHDDDTFRVDGAELNVVKLLGIVDSLTEHETNFTFKLNDGSGVLECKQWIDKGANGGVKLSKLK